MELIEFLKFEKMNRLFKKIPNIKLYSTSNFGYKKPKPGINKAYDEAINYLENYKQENIEEAKKLKLKLGLHKNNIKLICLDLEAYLKNIAYAQVKRILFV